MEKDPCRQFLRFLPIITINLLLLYAIYWIIVEFNPKQYPNDPYRWLDSGMGIAVLGLPTVLAFYAFVRS